jgi:beta-RFAP synthase
MSRRFVTVRTGARLHFGPLSYRPPLGRHFGGVGMMIDQPGVQITVEATPDRIPRPVHSSRVVRLLDAIFQSEPELRQPVEIDVVQEIPPHSGLGSGTQLAMALAEGLLALQSRKRTAVELARLGQRGDRSAIGLLGYESGGFLVDAGHRQAEAFGALAAQVPVPSPWRIILVRPHGSQGIFGAMEMTAFQKLPPMDAGLSGELCRLTLTEMLPALHQADFQAFAAALYEFGQLVGGFFSESQGGEFAHPVIRKLASQLPELRARGMAQSSWGPTVAILAASDDDAADVMRLVKSQPDAGSLQVEIAHPLNQGRTLLFHE